MFMCSGVLSDGVNAYNVVLINTVCVTQIVLVMGNWVETCGDDDNFFSLCVYLCCVVCLAGTHIEETGFKECFSGNSQLQLHETGPKNKVFV